ncbi:hypothetical protein D9M68_852250 [compost metagenome]
MASEPYSADTLPRTTSIRSIWSGRILASCAVPLLTDDTRTPSIRISVWLELAPRMNSEVLVPMPPLAVSSTPAWLRSSVRRSGACELTISSCVTTVVCGSASVMDCAVRVEVTTTGASCCAVPLSAACANEVAGTRVNEAMAAAIADEVAGTSGRTAGAAGRVDLWSDERMMQD